MTINPNWRDVSTWRRSHYIDSYARGDQTDASDLDMLVTLNAPLGWEFVDLCDHLAALLETNVNVVTQGAIDRKPLLRQFVEKNLIRV